MILNEAEHMLSIRTNITSSQFGHLNRNFGYGLCHGSVKVVQAYGDIL